MKHRKRRIRQFEADREIEESMLRLGWEPDPGDRVWCWNASSRQWVKAQVEIVWSFSYYLRFSSGTRRNAAREAVRPCVGRRGKF